MNGKEGPGTRRDLLELDFALLKGESEESWKDTSNRDQSNVIPLLNHPSHLRLPVRILVDELKELSLNVDRFVKSYPSAVQTSKQNSASHPNLV